MHILLACADLDSPPTIFMSFEMANLVIARADELEKSWNKLLPLKNIYFLFESQIDLGIEEKAKT